MIGKLKLAPGNWYGMTMYPGYSDVPYHSPIRIDGVTPSPQDERLIKVQYFNLGYAAGVKDMVYRLRLLREERHHVIAEIHATERSLILVPISGAWVERQAPWARPWLDDNYVELE